MKVLIVTLSDNADHQDIAFGMFESLYMDAENICDPWIMGISTLRVPIVDTPHTHLVDCPRRPGIQKETFNLRELFQIVRWVNQQCFDVIFFESLHVWNLAIMKFCHKKTKIFQMIHDIVPHSGDKQEKSVDLMNKVVCRMADDIVIANKKYVPLVTETYGVSPTRVHHIELWRRFPNFAPPRQTGRVLFFGRMNPYKGVNQLLEIAKRCPSIQFTVVGRIDPQVVDIVDELKTLSNVTFVSGYVTNDEMEDAFISADWVILPYNSATQSGVIIDAYRYGRPCIAFNVGAISEQVCDGISGFLIEPGNTEAFVKKLESVVEMDKDVHLKFCMDAYSYGLEKYSATRARQRFIEMLSEA